MARRITYQSAINEALAQEMERDETVVLMGEDIAGGMGAGGEKDAWGGVLGVTKGLYHRFPGRVLDTPITESAYIGAAAGADPQRLRRLERLIQLVQEYRQWRGPAVEIDPDAAGDPRTVVRHRDVGPSIDGDRALGLDANRVVEPALDQVDLDPAPVEDDAVTLALRLLDHPREDRPSSARALGLDPGGERERVVEAEGGDVAGIDEGAAVERDRRSHRTGR